MGGGGGGGGGSGCKLYVNNLPWNVSWQNLKDHFRSAGNVVRADVFTGADGRSKGCGIVEFSTPEEAGHAMQMFNDTMLNDRKIFVREDRED
jgi:RNA recognition motif-containing protein